MPPSCCPFCGNRLCAPKRAGGRTTMKMLVGDEVSRDVTARHTSPGIVGRLMGLDMMPSFGVDSQKKVTGNHTQNMSPGSCCDKSGSCSDKYALSGDAPRRRTDQIPESQDVFDVMETTRMKNHKCSPCSGLDKVNSADLNFVRQKFMDAKRLSTDESFQRSKEFNDALETLLSNKDLLMEILQESNNVVTSDLSDLSCSPSSGVNSIILLKPSRKNKFFHAAVVYLPEEDIERCYHAPKEAMHSPRKPYVNFSSQPRKEGTSFFRQILSRSSYMESSDECISPTRIVVLKPFLEKTQNMEGAFPLTHEMFRSSYRRTKARLDEGIQRPYAEESMPQVSTGDYDVLGHTGKGSREIVREVTAPMRRAVKGRVSGKQILNPDIGTDEQVSSLSSMSKLKSSEVFQRSYGLRDDSDAPSFGFSPTYTTKISIRKEARKRLSARWKMTHQFQHPSQDANTFSTLGDMLALSDKEASNFTSRAAACRKYPKRELHRDVMPGSCGYPLGISSNDGWKDENVSNLTRLKSISSSINGGSPMLSSRKASCRHSEFSMLGDMAGAGPYSSEYPYHGRPRRSLIRSSTYHCDERAVPSLDEAESVVTVREIHVNFEEPTYSVAVPEFSEAGGRPVHPADSNHNLGAERILDISSAVPERQDDAQASAQNEVIDQDQISTLDGNLIAPSLIDSASQTEGNGHDLCEDDQASFGSHVSSNEDDQPIPVSVFESSLDGEDCCSGGFEKISADLQDKWPSAKSASSFSCHYDY